MNELTKLADCLTTDKGLAYREGHGFTEFYYDYFKSLKDRGEKIYILELGILYGDSLEMYNEFFEGNCEIYGVDIVTSLYNRSICDNIHIYNFDASDKESVEKFLDEIGNIKFDFILDDASHEFNQQFKSYLYFYKNVKPNGRYIIEDLHTFSWGKKEDSPLNFLTFFEKPSILTDEEYEEIRNSIKYANIFVHNNKNAYCGNGTSSTAIITLNN